MKDTQTFSTRRIEALSDGVFAIAMTLLVLDLAIPASASIQTNEDLLSALQDLLPQLRNFVISFLLLGVAWGVHQRQFEFINKSNRHLTFLNNLRLMFAVLIPFTTTVANDFPELTLGVMLLPLNFFLLAAVSYWQWHYASRAKTLTKNMDEFQRVRGEMRNKVIMGISLLVTVAVLIAGEYAFFLFFLTPFAMNYGETRLKKQKS